ncbi:hypothetical protein BDZ91DRAFT_714560 [Kalaharituber pfeilii]|nr:hypothetical protein BDZ91DRAFT_731647 [Kalaharituber pfeilii]KAF8472783.1 hypothetical protein BDZ91DRAFT_715801 [Kalaharituber pfeilii]KAF8473394.1 hypothetical protein BDZ91DRAFT_714560 [Kalaharituber pfeilii]
MPSQLILRFQYQRIQKLRLRHLLAGTQILSFWQLRICCLLLLLSCCIGAKKLARQGGL